MAVRFRHPFNILIEDLARGGYSIQSVVNIPQSRGRSADVHLANGVVVSWDPYTQSIWTEGPHELWRRVEAYLHNIYERGWLPRWIVMQRARLVARKRTKTPIKT